MKFSSLVYIFALIIGAFVFFSRPISTGHELIYQQDLFLTLPTAQTNDLLIQESLLEHTLLIPFEAQNYFGAFAIDQGLVRWIQKLDFAAVNQEWVTSYSYQETSPQIVSLTTQTTLQYNPGWFPIITPDWIGYVNAHANTIRFGKDLHMPLSGQSWSWASIISSIHGNSSYFAVSLIDGRVFIFSEGEDAPRILVPHDDWFTAGIFSQRIPVNISFISDYLIVVYGSLEPRAIVWDSKSWEVVQQFKLYGITQPEYLAIYGFENNQGELWIDFRDGIDSFHARFSPLEATIQRNENLGKKVLSGYLSDLNIAVYEETNLVDLRSVFHFFRANITGDKLISTNPFSGTLISHPNGVLWFGQEVYGQVSLSWSNHE